MPHAQIGHAAGQSSRLSVEYPDDTSLIVKAVTNEQELLAVESRLQAAGVSFRTFREPDAPYLGAATAIGCCPGPRAQLKKLLQDLPLLK